jgi:hypothetical protein
LPDHPISEIDAYALKIVCLKKINKEKGGVAGDISNLSLFGQ